MTLGWPGAEDTLYGGSSGVKAIAAAVVIGLGAALLAYRLLRSDSESDSDSESEADTESE